MENSDIHTVSGGKKNVDNITKAKVIVVKTRIRLQWNSSVLSMVSALWKSQSALLQQSQIF